MPDDTTTTEPTEVQPVEFELPPDVAAGFPESSDDTSAHPVETAPVSAPATEPARPAKVVPIQALDAERKKRQEAQRESLTLADRVEQARRDQAAAAARQQAIDDAAKREQVDYNALPDLNAVAAKLRDELTADTRSQVNTLNTQLLVTKVKWSEQYWRDKLDDYDARLAESGVADALTIDPSTGRFKDPFLAGVIYNADDPAMFAYEYASGKLGQQVERKARQDGYQAGAKATIDSVKAAAARPRGIATLPASSAGRTQFRVSDIARMSDGQQRWIKKNKPDIWRQYMESEA